MRNIYAKTLLTRGPTSGHRPHPLSVCMYILFTCSKILEHNDDDLFTEDSSVSTDSSNLLMSDNTIDMLLELKAGILSTRTLEPRSPIIKQNGYRDVLLQLPENDLRQALRMNIETFEYVLSLIEHHNVFQNKSFNKQADVWLQLAVALERFGCDGNGVSTGRVARQMGMLMVKVVKLSVGIGNGTVSLYTDRVIVAILSLKRDFMTWPTDQERLNSSLWFESRFAMKGAVGIVDGTHFHFHERPHIDGEVFWTRKHRYSVNGTVYETH